MVRFDLLVNGGGAVTLELERPPFRPVTMRVTAPWNTIRVLEPIVLRRMDEIQDGDKDKGEEYLS